MALVSKVEWSHGRNYHILKNCITISLKILFFSYFFSRPLLVPPHSSVVDKTLKKEGLVVDLVAFQLAVTQI